MPPNRAASDASCGGPSGENPSGEHSSSAQPSSEERSSEASASSGQTSDARSSDHRPSGQSPTYDAVTAYFTCEEKPLRVEHVQALRKSHFPMSGEEAVQVIQDLWAPVPDRSLGDAGKVLEARAEGLFEMHLILLRPEKIDFLLLERGGDRWEASLEAVLE